MKSPDMILAYATVATSCVALAFVAWKATKEFISDVAFWLGLVS